MQPARRKHRTDRMRSAKSLAGVTFVKARAGRFRRWSGITRRRRSSKRRGSPAKVIAD